MVARTAVLLALLVGGCPPKESDVADCPRSGACQESGRCTLDPKTKRCVVGSDADCAKSKVCNKQNRCRKVGDTCGE
jgi:hypothetical protein